MQVRSQQLEIVKPLGLGPEACVSLVRDVISGARLVLRESKAAPNAQASDLIRQIRLLRQLDQSGFVGVDDVVWRNRTRLGFTTAFVESQSMVDIAKENGIPELIGILRLICQSMAYLHSLDYLHGDLKPANILVEIGGGKPVPRITDLGLTVRRGAQFPTEIRGSHGYMAPEVLEGQPLTEAIDIYSFGRIVQELADGSVPKDSSRELANIAQVCTCPRPEDRPQSFWEIDRKLARLTSGVPAETTSPGILPPLRPAGLRLRQRMVGRLFESDGTHHGHLCLVSGPSGIGKSKLIREFCLEQQLKQEPTLRLSGVESPDGLVERLNFLSDQTIGFTDPPRASLQWIFIETAPSCEFTPTDLHKLREVAEDRRMNLLIESRDASVSGAPAGTGVFRVHPLTLRECTASSSHLTFQSTLAVANGEALHVATGGIPFLMRRYLTHWLGNGRHGQPAEPLNFDTLTPDVSEYWRNRFARLSAEHQAVLAGAAVFHRTIQPQWLECMAGVEHESVPSLEELVNSGWLSRGSGEMEARRYQFTARSARNFIRWQEGEAQLRAQALNLMKRESWIKVEEHFPQESWELHRLARCPKSVPGASELAAHARSLEDRKLVVRAALGEYRERRRNSVPRIDEASILNDSYSRLGSARRHARWAQVALQLMTTQSASTILTLKQAQCQCRLLDINGDLLEKETAINQLLSMAPGSDGQLRGYLMSELAVIHILRLDYKRARVACYEAHHLLHRAAADTEEFARNLNRLGLLLLLTGSYTEAERQLKECQALCTQFGWDDVLWRCLANLGMLAKEIGNPALARNYQRRVRDHYRMVCNPQDHLRALNNLVMTNVDLGQGYVAIRTARLGIALADAISDRGQQARAHSLLGLVLTMRGELGSAKVSLDTAISLRKRIGDHIGAARMNLNLARLYLVAANSLLADRACAEVMEEFTREEDLEGVWEASRLRARAAILRDDFDTAAQHLSLVRFDHPLLSLRDRTETMLTSMARHLWMENIEAAEETRQQLLEFPMVERVHPLNCEMGRLLGHLALLKGDYDQSLRILGQTATRCRTSGRIDHLMETLKIMVLLASRMHNWQIGIRYLTTAENLLQKMRGELE